MHKLLARQLRSAAHDGGDVDLDALLRIVDQAYTEFDRERRLNDRAARLMEEELVEANRQTQREHETALATILVSATDGMLVTHKNGTVEIANSAAEVQFGCPAGALIGQSIYTLMGANALAIARPSGNDDSGIAPHDGTATAADGRTFPVEFSVNPLEIAGKTRLLWIVRDVSERTRAQREILESRMRFQDFAEASSDCFWEIGANLTKVEARASGATGLREGVVALLTPGPNGASPDGVNAEAWIVLRHSMAARQPFRDFRLSIDRNGATVHLSLSGKPVYDLDGLFAGYRGTVRDMTREFTAREDARRAERQLIEAMETAPNAIALIDSNLRFTAGNSMLRQIAPQENDYLWPGELFARFLERTLKNDGTLEGGMTPTELLRALIDDGHPREVRIGVLWVIIAARRMADGGAVVTFSDVTKLKTREREFAEAKRNAESASRLKSQFLATMSHELRTPLNAILGFSEVIRDSVLGHSDNAREKYMQYASSIHTSGQHLLALISEILDLSKIEAGSYVLERERLDVHAVLDSALTIITPAAEKAGVTLEWIAPDRPVHLLGDDRSLRQITLNLLGNAVKFTPAGGRVTVELDVLDGAIAFRVIDTGVGIDRSQLESVFEPFRQADASVRRRHEGTGLGLAITKRLVEMHRGTVTIESELGAGTCVTVRLPVAESEGPLDETEAA